MKEIEVLNPDIDILKAIYLFFKFVPDLRDTN